MAELRVLIGCNSMKKEAVEISGRISALLREASVLPCTVGSELAAKIGAEPILSTAGCTHIVTVGGDGTILKWGKTAALQGIPLLGVNMGRLGFMATLEPHEIDRIPQLLQSGRHISSRMLMECEICREDGTSVLKHVMNDVIISRDSCSKLPEFCVSCSSVEVSRLRADGMIFSTPTGSTAYSLSAGGPIIAPDMECIEVTALCPHTLFNRPMLFSAAQTVSCRCTSYQGSRVTVSVDGENGIAFGEGDVLILNKSPYSLRLIETGEGFFGAIHDKLLQPLK